MKLQYINIGKNYKMQRFERNGTEYEKVKNGPELCFCLKNLNLFFFFLLIPASEILPDR